MTLHEAIEKILLDVEGPLPAEDIATLITKQKLYTKKDGKPISANQIILRANNYNSQFDVLNNLISLKKNVELSNVIDGYKNLRKVFSELPALNRDYISLFLLFVKRLQDVGEYHIGIIGGGLKTPNGQIENISRITGSVKDIQIDYPLLTPISLDVIHLFDERLPRFKALEALHYFESIKTAKLKDEEFIALFNRLISETDKYNNKIPLCTSTNTLRELLAKVFTPNEGDKVFDPFLGVAGHFIQLHQRCNYNIRFSGQDENEMAIALATMNLKISGIVNPSLNAINSFAIPNLDKFDYVISDPPFLGNSKIEMQNRGKHFATVLGENGIVKASVAPYIYIIDILAESGRAAFSAPESLLFAGGPEAKFRECLIKNDWLEAIVALPPAYSGSTSGIKLNLIIVNKEKDAKFKGVVQFLDFRDKKIAEFQILQNIVDCYVGKKKSESSYYITSEEIANEGYSLLPRRYNPGYMELLAQRTQQGKKLVKLGNLVNKIKLEAAPVGKEFLFVSSIYSNATKGFELIPTLFKSIEVERKGYYILNRSAILIDKSSLTLHARIFKYTGEPIILGASIVAVELSSSEISDKFLCYQLNLDVISIVQMFRYSQGTISGYITERDLFNMLIEMLSIEEQNVKLVDYLSKEEQKQGNQPIDINTQISFKEESGGDIIPTLKHTLNQPLATIRDGLYSLKDFLINKANKNEPIFLNENLAPNLPDNDPDKASYTLINHLELIMSNAALAQQYLQRVEGLTNLDSYELQNEKFDVIELLNKICANQFRDSNCIIEIQGKAISVKTDKQLFTAIVQNIIQNALKHGFSAGRNKKDNILRIIVARENFGIMDVSKGAMADMLSVSFENNGVPIEASLLEMNQRVDNLKHSLEAKGGFGLIFIRKVIKKLGGKLEIRQIPKDSLDDFKTKFAVLLEIN